MKIDKQEVFFTFVDMPCLADETDRVLAPGEKQVQDASEVTEEKLKAAMQGRIKDGVVVRKDSRTYFI